MKETATLWWDEALPGIRYIDQTLLPTKYAIVRCTSVDRLITAIKRLEIRGAPALGVAGGYGVALAANVLHGSIVSTRLPVRYGRRQDASGRAGQRQST